MQVFMSGQVTPLPVALKSDLSVNQRLMLNLALKGGVGVVASGLTALIAFRRGGSRLFAVGLGTGSGLGYAWAQNDFYLKHPQAVELPGTLEGEFDRYWSQAARMVPDFARFK